MQIYSLLFPTTCTNTTNSVSHVTAIYSTATIATFTCAEFPFFTSFGQFCPKFQTMSHSVVNVNTEPLPPPSTLPSLRRHHHLHYHHHNHPRYSAIWTPNMSTSTWDVSCQTWPNLTSHLDDSTRTRDLNTLPSYLALLLTLYLYQDVLYRMFVYIDDLFLSFELHIS